jgi:hypothetical protein
MSKKPKVSIVRLTPAQCAKLLEKNNSDERRNRPISEPHVNFFVDEINNGRWQLTQDAIVVDWNDCLGNGQHRLTASVKSGKPIDVILMEDVDPSMVEVMDLGRARSVRDVLNMIYGVKRAHLITGAINALDAILEDRKIKLSVGHALEMIDRYNLAFRWAAETFPGRHTMVCSPIVAALVYAYKADPERVEEFARRIFTGTNLTEGAPALAFVNWVRERRGLFTTKAEKRECFGACLMAARSHIRGTKLQRAKSTQDALLFFKSVYAVEKRKAVG